MAGKRRIDKTKIVDLKRTLGVKIDILDNDQKKENELVWVMSQEEIQILTMCTRLTSVTSSKKILRGRPPKRRSDLIRGDKGIPPLTAERRARDTKVERIHIQEVCKDPRGIMHLSQVK